MDRRWRPRLSRWALPLSLCLVAGSQFACSPGILRPPSLSPETLRNAEYPSEFTRSGRAVLRDGTYEESAAEGSALKVVVRLAPPVARGQLAGRDVAAVVLFTNAGGSGTFFRLVVVEEGPRGPRAIAEAPLGDRIQLRSLGIADEEVVVEVIRQGPRDPLCCPAERARLRFVLETGRLVERGVEIWRERAAGLWGETWRLTRIEQESVAAAVADPSRYTLRFSPDGTVAIRADCNMGGGSYSVDGSRLEIRILHLTRAQCPPGSLADEYLRDLGRARLYTFGGDGLQLQTEPEGATLYFSHD
jgi:heat shock protein HslJ